MESQKTQVAAMLQTSLLSQDQHTKFKKSLLPQAIMIDKFKIALVRRGIQYIPFGTA